MKDPHSAQEAFGLVKVGMNIPFASPSTIGIFGPTQVGKSFLLKQLLVNSSEVFASKPIWFLYCYAVELPIYQELREVHGNKISFKQGIPSSEEISEFSSKTNHGIVVLDDLMIEVSSDSKALSLFTVGSHHLNLTVIFIRQNIFPGGKFSRSISLNLHYLILFKNLSDSLQIKHRARQIFPGRTKEFMEIFNDATSKPYGYLVIDLSPSADDEFHLRTRVLPNERAIIYSM